MLKRFLMLVFSLTVISMVSIGCSQKNSNPGLAVTISENVTWSIGQTSVTATITRPETGGRHPAIVFVAGSGPTDRDWNTPLLPGTSGSAKMMAGEFASLGFVTIRYDKRFTGPEAQKNIPLLIGKISMESHVEEIAGAVGQLVARSDVDSQRIFVVANSEGTIHAMNYQLEREPKFAGLVLLAPPGRNMMDLTHSQLSAQMASLPNGNEIMAEYDQLIADFLADKPFTPESSLPDVINNLMQSLYAPANLPFTAELFRVDPPSLLNRIQAPVLVAIGKKDVQVDWQADGSLLEAAAAGHNNVTFEYPENANHVFKNEPRPRNALTAADALTYNASDRVLDADALKTITDWLKEQTDLK